MARRLFVLTVAVLLALFLLPRPYMGRQVSAGDLPTLELSPAVFRPAPETLLDVNTATIEQLQTLPGIGPARAQGIVDYRTQNGPFHTVEELAAVDGIGMGILEQIREQIIVYLQEE